MRSAVRKKSVTKTPNGTEGTSYNAPAVDKALDVLELLSDVSRGMSLTSISDALGRTKQELFRVLLCLHERGYLVRDDTQNYRLSTKLFEIGSRHASMQTLIARAVPQMENLVNQLGESCHLNIVVQNHMLVVVRVECAADVMLTVRVGATFELHRRTSGLVGLAYQPERRRREYWNQSQESARRAKAYEVQFTQIRERGFAQVDSAVAIGVVDCAAPILGCCASLLGVLCVSHIKRRDELNVRRDIARAVVKCARAISAEFGPVS